MEPPAAEHLSLVRGAFNGELKFMLLSGRVYKTFLRGPHSGMEFFSLVHVAANGKVHAFLISIRTLIRHSSVVPTTA